MYKLVVYDSGRENGIYEARDIEEAYEILYQLVVPSLQCDRVAKIIDDNWNTIETFLVKNGVVIR